MKIDVRGARSTHKLTPMLIKHLKVSGLLSFGPKGIDLPMRKLNVLIGANGSGKSNLLEVISLLRASATKLSDPITNGGGIRNWLWKTQSASDETEAAHIDSVIYAPKGAREGVRHIIEFGASGEHLYLRSESIEAEKPFPGKSEIWWYYRLRNETALYHDGDVSDSENDIREEPRNGLNSEESILSQRKDPSRYEVFDYLETRYESIAIYREWVFGTSSPIRQPQRTGESKTYLYANGSNLALVLGAFPPSVKRQIVQELRPLYEGIRDYRIVETGGYALLFLVEDDGREIPSSRLSDGTLRYLFLLTILLHPDPPPLTAIEEPELGMHPDVIPQIAKLLKEASERTQLIVTTHSRLLVDALGDDPESVIVCEKHDGESVFERLDGERMKVWLEKYSLGDLWSKGELGGNRW